MRTLAILATLLTLSTLPPLLAQETRETPPSAEGKLSKFETSLLGKWYFAGDKNKVCHFVSAGNTLFTINEETNALAVQSLGDGLLYATRPDYTVSCKVQGDYALWSNGFWWSRKPVEWPADAARRALEELESSRRQPASAEKTAGPRAGLTAFETSLLGKWYFAGDESKVGYIVNASGTLFQINEAMTALELKSVGDHMLQGTRPDGSFFFLSEGDAILCSNGIWDSKKPVTWRPGKLSDGGVAASQ
ncbi:MAG: hypothetical protein ACREKL_15355 [Chthoniobacterales bacterium]